MLLIFFYYDFFFYSSHSLFFSPFFFIILHHPLSLLYLFHLHFITVAFLLPLLLFLLPPLSSIDGGILHIMYSGRISLVAPQSSWKSLSSMISLSMSPAGLGEGGVSPLGHCDSICSP